MAFTDKDRKALAEARRIVESLGEKEQQAIDFMADVCTRAGLDVARGASWQQIAAQADAIRDALEPFDSGVRCKDEVA